MLVFVFLWNYPSTALTRDREFASFGRSRGFSIHSVEHGPQPPPEIVHEHSSVVVGLDATTVFVIEWSEGVEIDRHRVTLEPMGGAL